MTVNPAVRAVRTRSPLRSCSQPRERVVSQGIPSSTRMGASCRGRLWSSSHMLHLFGSKPQNFREAVGRETRIIIGELVRGHADRKTFQHLRDRNTRSFYRRLPTE